MNSTHTYLLTARRLRLSLLIVVALAALYFILYNGRIESGDSLRMFDGISSLIDYGDTRIDRAAYQFPPALSEIFAGLQPPLTDVSVEPGQVIAAAPLYALARLIPGLGLVHVVWLFNLFVTAAACAVFFFFALALGENERTAAAAALLLGTATILLPYTGTFFREPLTLLWLLIAALALARLRALHYRAAGWALTALAALVGLTLTKASGLLALPALLLIGLPAIRRFDRRAALLLIAAGALIAGVFIVFGVFDLIPALGARYSVLRRLSELTTEHLNTAIAAYLLSPGGSLWGTSPILLLAIPGAWRLIRGGRTRMVLVALAAIGAFAVGYALLNAAYWFGGLSWPPRFLVPIVPLALIPALPVIRHLTRPSRGWWIAGPLIGYSLYIQFTGAVTFWADYAELLPPEAGRLLDWPGGLYDPRLFRWTLLPQQLALHPPEFAWWLMRDPIWPISAALVSVMALALLLNETGRLRTSGPFARRLSLALIPLLLVVIGLNLGRLYPVDYRYLAADDTLHRAYALLRAETRPDDVILLSSPRYASFFLNDAPPADGMGRVIALPLQPGERPSPEEPAPVTSDNPAALLHGETIALISALAAQHDRLWLLSHGSPELWWSVRPVERYLSAHYYPIRFMRTGDNTRLIEYATTPAPDPYVRYGPSIPTDLIFGADLRLIGIELPAGTTFRPGQAVPVSLYWEGVRPLEANFTVALFLRRPDGGEVTQTDWQPGGGFHPTSGWISGVPVQDPRGLRLPPDLPPGEYPLWVKVYDFAPDGSRRDLPVTAGARLDETIGVLPVTIRVASSVGAPD